MIRTTARGDEASHAEDLSMHVSSRLILGLDPAVLALLDADPRPSLIVDADSTIHFLNAAYVESARSGPGGAAFLERWGLGARLLDACHGQVKLFIADALEAALGVGAPCQHRYPCHTPERLQHFMLTVLPLKGLGMALLTHARFDRIDDAGEHVVIEPTLGPLHFDPDGRVTQCLGCQLVRRVDDHALWEPVAEAFRGLPGSIVRVGLCASCTVAFKVALTATLT